MTSDGLSCEIVGSCRTTLAMHFAGVKNNITDCLVDC